jgi:hypothetical protein
MIREAIKIKLNVNCDPAWIHDFEPAFDLETNPGVTDLSNNTLLLRSWCRDTVEDGARISRLIRESLAHLRDALDQFSPLKHLQNAFLYLR